MQGYGGLTQLITNTPGNNYTISFWLSDNGPLGVVQQLSTNGNVTGTGGNGIDLLVSAGAIPTLVPNRRPLRCSASAWPGWGSRGAANKPDCADDVGKTPLRRGFSWGRGGTPRQNARMRARRIAGFAAIAILSVLCAQTRGEERVQLDPFAQATRGYPACPAPPPPLLSQDEARAQAHVRVERGLRCAMEGKCEPGGAYKRDPEINDRTRSLIDGDPRFANTSVWVTTSRKWVTLQGCVHSMTQRKALIAFVAHQRDIEKVFDELVVGTKPAPRSSRIDDAGRTGR